MEKQPVIAVRSGGPTESILHEKTGFLCDDNPAAFATAMSELLKNRQMVLFILSLIIIIVIIIIIIIIIILIIMMIIIISDYYFKYRSFS